MNALFDVVVPAALIVFAGYLFGRRIQVDLPTLTKLTLYVLAPALTADAMYRSQLSKGEAGQIFLAFALSTTLLYILVRVICRVGNVAAPVRKSLVATTLFPNTGNLGLSLTLLALGQEGLDRAVVVYVASGLLVFGLGPGIVSGEGFRKGVKSTLRLPTIWGLSLGIAFRLLDIRMPVGLESSLHILAQAAIPVLLVTLGIQISRTRFRPAGGDLLAASLRLGAGPIAAYAAATAVGLSTLTTQVFVLQLATPTAVNALLVASEFGGDAPRAARAVVLSSLLAFATIPLVMWLFGIG
jgi:predicted permease